MAARSKYYVLDADHQPVPCDLTTFASWYNDPANCRVAYTVVAEDVAVSTVCLGIDHNFTNDSPPILFETMVTTDYGFEGETRYASWAEAEQNHHRVVEHIRKKLLQASAGLQA